MAATMATMMAAQLLGLLLLLLQTTSASPLLDTLLFGDASSEAAHRLNASGVDAVPKSAGKTGQPCRSPCASAASCRSGWPSESFLSFRMAVDPSAQTYLTVKFDGSETSSSTMVTLLNESFGGSVSDCSYPPELNLW